MIYTQDIHHALGEGKVDALRHKALSRQAQALMPGLRRRMEAGELPLFSLPYHTGDLMAINALAETMRGRFRTLVVMGTGGSSLGGKTLVAMKQSRLSEKTPYVKFLDNVDPEKIAGAIASLDLNETGFLAISKSGSTVETLSLTLTMIAAVKERLGEDALAGRFWAITVPGDNPLRRIGAHYGFQVIDHDPALGGRFSVFSEVGLLPAAVAGLDIAALRKGAASVMDNALHVGDEHISQPAAGAALQVAMVQAGRPITVLMPYVDTLKCLGSWFLQIWAESVGKQGKGSTAVQALGAVDQHSQLQLYLDGPRDKFFTLITLNNSGKGPIINDFSEHDNGLAHIHGRHLGDVMQALQQGTIDTLVNHACPLRLITLEALDEFAMGALMMHFMLETILAAGLLGVNAFDQPAVEESKQRARDYLKRAGG